MSLGKLLPLSTGTKLPQIGLGTGMLKSKECEDVVACILLRAYIPRFNQTPRSSSLSDMATDTSILH